MFVLLYRLLILSNYTQALVNQQILANKCSSCPHPGTVPLSHHFLEGSDDWKTLLNIAIPSPFLLPLQYPTLGLLNESNFFRVN